MKYKIIAHFRELKSGRLFDGWRLFEGVLNRSIKVSFIVPSKVSVTKMFSYGLATCFEIGIYVHTFLHEVSKISVKT